VTRTAVLVTEGVRKAERFPVSLLRKAGQPARQPKQKNKLTRNERAYYEAVLEAFASIPYSAIENQFLAPITADVATPITDTLTEYQEYLGDLTLLQLDQSGTAIFNGIKTDVAAQWARLEKAVTPSQFATSLNFNRASPAAVTYASMSAANMVTDMVDTQIVAVRNLVTQAYKDGLSRPQTSSSLVKLLNKMPAPRGTPTGLAGAANIFGDATRGLTNRYAMAVYHRTEKIMSANPGTTPRQLKKQAEAYGKRLRGSRARMISRTEMMRASNQGRLQGMLQAADQGLINPVLAKKQWVTSSFDVCPICVPLNGQTVGLRETFGNRGQAPPAHPNCRCVIREVPDPLTYGTPRSVGTGMTGSPMQFVRPSKPGLKIQDLMAQPGVVGQPGALVGQPGAAPPIGDAPTRLPAPVPEMPVASQNRGIALVRQNEHPDLSMRGPLGGKADYEWKAEDFPDTMTGKELASGNFREWPDSSSRADWIDNVKPDKLRQSKEMGLHQSIQEQGIGYPIDVQTWADGRMSISSGAHRVAVAEDLGLTKVPVRYWGKEYESVFGKFSNYSDDEIQRLKELFPQRGHGKLGYGDFEPGEIPFGGTLGPQGKEGFARAEAALRAREARLAALEAIDSGPITPAQPLLAPSTTEAVVEITEEVRAEGAALIKELRQQARTSAQREFDDVTGYLETLTDINMDVAGVLSRPPKVKWVRDPLLGRVRVDVKTGQPPAGNWDWWWDIPEKQKVRMRRRGVFAEPGKKALGPDELTDMIIERTAIEMEGEAMDLFLDLSQRRFTLASLKDGRGNLVKESIDTKMIPELEDSGFAWEILTGEIDDDVIAGVMKWATTAADDAVDELGRLLSNSRHGTNPWQMDINEYWTELHDVSVKRRAIQPLRTTDEFGAEYSVADQAVIDRFDELVPPNLVDDIAMINTAEGIENLHLDILEQAAIEGWL
jgi:hypothetical protein